MEVIEERFNGNHQVNKEYDSWFGTRHIQIGMLFLLVSVAYGMRVNLPAVIIAMTDPSISSNSEIPIYNYTDKSIVLSSFFWGYILPNVSAGELAKAYGAKWFLVGAMTVTSVFSSLIPICASFGSWGVIVCRVFQGFAQGFIFPSCHTMLGKWVPSNERARLGTFVYVGCSVGTVVSLNATGFICSSGIGWPGTFYLFSVLGILWTIAWIFVGSSCPSEHSGINISELKYIEASLGRSVAKDMTPTPWISISTSLPFWALCGAHIGHNWGFSTMIINIPRYLNGVLNYNVEKDDVISAGPYLIFWTTNFLFSAMTDYLIIYGILSTGAARKLANSIGAYVSAIVLITLGLASRSKSDNANLIWMLILIHIGVNLYSLSGYHVNHMDLSPVHAGTLMGISNCLANIFSIITPSFIQWIVTDDSDPFQWAIVFYTTAAVYVVGTTVFIFFGSGEIQPWNSRQATLQVAPYSIT